MPASTSVSGGATSGKSRAGKGVILKLFLASLCMVSVPILVFFAFHSWGLSTMILGEDSKYKMALSGGMSALAVNIILIVYVIMAFMEDAQTKSKSS